MYSILSVEYLDFGCGGEQRVVGVLQALLLEALGLGANQEVEVGCQVTPEQCLAGRDVEEQREGLHVEARLQDLAGGPEPTKGRNESTVQGSTDFHCHHPSLKIRLTALR